MARSSTSDSAVYEALANEVCSLERTDLIERLTHFGTQLPLDFSPEYLATCSTDQMRHWLVAALWRCEIKRKNTAQASKAPAASLSFNPPG